MIKHKPRIALLGNPNVGKTAVFNLLTGLDQKVSNYPGITVEKKSAPVKLNNKVPVIFEDYPGTYSLISQSLDEQIVTNSFYDWVRDANKKPDIIIYIAEYNNIRRNLYLFTQFLELNIPSILLLNMNDIVIEENKIDHIQLIKELNIENVIPFSATKQQGLLELKNQIIKTIDNESILHHNVMPVSDTLLKVIKPIKPSIQNIFNIESPLLDSLSFRFLCNTKHIDNIALNEKDKNKINNISNVTRKGIDKDLKSLITTMEADLRYGWIDTILMKCSYKKIKVIERQTRSEKIDKVLTHTVFGPLIFVSILYFIFQSIFSFASIPMDYIDSMMSHFGNFISNNMNAGLFRDLVVDGIIAGIGGIVIFLPQILLLMFFMTLLEDTGYMTRATFMMDKFMRKMGLHGKSVLPIMSGYACAIPGIISTRTIDSWKERLITILILPLVSCSARLPVYVLMIGAFIPERIQGLTMVVMYFLGTITAFILAKIFSKFLKNEKSNPSFVIELPSYRVPIINSVIRQVFNRGKLFLVDAGKIIMCISIILWFLLSFPRDGINPPKIEDSYGGIIGHTIEPIIKPLGFDWKIGIALVSSFAAREVVVSTLSTIYNLGDDGDDMVILKEAMKNDVDPETGNKVFTPVVAVSLMVFYVYAAQCMATFSVVRTETNTWKWPAFMIIYMTVLAYGMSFIVFQGGRFLGFT